MLDNNTEIKVIKIGVIGDSAVGKTAICNSFIGNEFTVEGQATIGCEKFDKKILLEDGKEIKLAYWDTAGAERFHEIVFKTLKTSQGIVLVFDITNKNTFNNIHKWLDGISENLSNPTIVLLGNKKDSDKDKWKVTQEEIDSLVKQKNLVYFETSAKTKKGINESINYLANMIVTNIQLKEKYPGENNNDKIKKLLFNELNHYKNEFDKLMKDYVKLKEDNDKLNNELNNAKYTIYNFEDKIKKNLDEINNQNNIILQKDDEIINLKLKIKNLENFNTKSFNTNDIVYVHFISSDKNINCPIKCLKNDTFAEVEEKLYQKYRKYRETNNKFLSKEKTVMRFKTIIENSINDGDEIELVTLD